MLKMEIYMDNVKGFFGFVGFALTVEFFAAAYFGFERPSSLMVKWINSNVPGMKKSGDTNTSSGASEDGS